MTTTGPGDIVPDDVPDVKIPHAMLAHWATVTAYAVANPDTAIDALLELAEGLEDVLAGDR